MDPTRKALVSAAAAIALCALPIKFDPATGSGLVAASAYAKSENGGGNDRGGGRERGNSGECGNGGGGSGTGSSNGKSASAPGKSQSGSNGQIASAGGLLNSLFGAGQLKKPVAPETRRTAPKAAKAKQNPKTPSAKVLPASVAVPNAKPKNLHARLGALNSLKRNYNAYLHSQSPRMALVREYVIQSAKADLAAETLAAATEKAAQSQAAFDAAVSAIQPYDGSAPIADPTTEALQARLDALNAMEPPTDTAELDSFNAEKQALSDALTAAEELAADEQAVAEAQAAADAAAVGTSDADLREALAAAANKDVAGEIDDEMMEWARDVLGVGDAYGKIDEVKAELGKSTPAAPETVDPAPDPMLVLAPAGN